MLRKFVYIAQWGLIMKILDRVVDSEGNISYLDPSTRQAVDVGEEVYIQTYAQREQARRYFAEAQRRKSLRDEYGEFVWSLYNISEEMFPALDGSDITRLIYLATYTGYDGRLVGTDGNLLDRNHIEQLMRISAKEYGRFWETMTTNNMLVETDSGVFINADMFRRGSLANSKGKPQIPEGKNFIRVFVDGVRSLYRSATPRSHKQLSYLFRALPYVNREYNLICFNPSETDIDYVEPMNVGDFCELVGYRRSNASRLVKALMQPTFEIRRGGQKVSANAIHFVVSASIGRETWEMYVNPMVFYAGTSWESVRVLGRFGSHFE